MYNINFITFGSHDNYIDAGYRLINQASDLKIFNNIKLYSKDDLKNDNNFWSLHKNFIINNPRGFGYWIWKPYLIKKNMDEMKNNDILLYLDCGCEIDVNEKDYLIECIEIVKKDYIIGTFGKTLVENSCKMDLIMMLDMNKKIYLKSKMHQAGANLILVCNETRKLINEWYELCCNYNLIDDSISNNINLIEFIEHRHDQSIYSLLTKKYNLYSVVNLDYKCIKCLRNRYGDSKLIQSQIYK
jgi:hypothetical protein